MGTRRVKLRPMTEDVFRAALASAKSDRIRLMTGGNFQYFRQAQFVRADVHTQPQRVPMCSAGGSGSPQPVRAAIECWLAGGCCGPTRRQPKQRSCGPTPLPGTPTQVQAGARDWASIELRQLPRRA